MDKQGLLFIPDISGFTQFVSQSDIEHSRLIIQELLETLINANHMELEISEVEGDAILFYKYGEQPPLEELYAQVEKMFCAFHRCISLYDTYRFCWCPACNSAVNLTLKIITHYGEFTGYNVKTFNKLIGKDVIVAHQLLKNEIEQHEYWLVTKNVLQDKTPAGLARWMQWRQGLTRTENGELLYVYTQLGPLKNEIAPEPGLQFNLSNYVKMISLTKEYDADIVTLFHAVGDFNYRSRWRKGVRKVEGFSHILPRVGMQFRCLLEDGEETFYYSSYTHDEDKKVQFSETDEGRKSSTQYTIENIGENKSRLTIDYYLQKGILNQLIFSLTKKQNLVNDLRGSMDNLAQLVREINLPA